MELFIIELFLITIKLIIIELRFLDIFGLGQNSFIANVILQV